MSMVWFAGNIAEAVQISKSKNAIFVIYIEGEDAKSQEFNQMLANEQVVDVLGSNNFVALKLQANSTEHQQFKEFYKEASSPSLYFIGDLGKPIEIITSSLNSDALCEKIYGMLEKKGVNVSQYRNKVGANLQNITKNVVEQKVVQSSPIATPSTSAVKESKEAEKDDRQRMILEHEREKMERQKERERVLAQIAQDRAENAVRMKAYEYPKPETSTKPASQAPVVNANSARLQFKLPNGSSHMHEFQATDTLQTVRSYLSSSIPHMPSHYSLSTAFPRREFTEVDNSSSLVELSLVPTAVILVLPVHGGVLASTSAAGIPSIFAWLLSPVFYAVNFFRIFLFGRAPTTGSAEAESTPEASSKRSNEEASIRNPPKRRNTSGTTVIRRQGNIHRLTDRVDDDDENNTWNGNSTQQM